jgi:hypothetical protein
MGLASFGRIDGLLNVARANLPRRVESSGAFDDWAIVGPALVGICADQTEGILASIPPRGQMRAEILSRSLCEYAITFAWLAGAKDDEERKARLQQFVAYEFRQRESAERKLIDQIGKQKRYEHLFESQRVPGELLGEESRDPVKSFEGTSSRPDALQMAFQADKRWMDEFELMKRNPFALMYFLVFTGSSFTTHASVTSVDRVVIGNPPQLVVGIPKGLEGSEQHGVYGLSVALLIFVLLISSRVHGWPLEGEVMAAANRDMPS